MVAAPDDERGSVVRAVVVLRDGLRPLPELARELQEHVKRETAPYKYPRIVEFVAELPKTPAARCSVPCSAEHESGETVTGCTGMPVGRVTPDL